MKKAIYLCGPINNCTDAEAKGWREDMKTQLHMMGFATLDPMRRDYRGREKTAYRELVENDKLDVASCNALLVSFGKIDSPMVGTSMEIMYAWERGIPVIVVVPEDYNPSPWLVYHATHVVTSYLDALHLIECELAEPAI